MNFNTYITGYLGNLFLFSFISILLFKYNILIALLIIPIGMIFSSLLIDNNKIIATETQIYILLTTMLSWDIIFCCYSAFCLYKYTNSWMGILIGFVLGFKITKYSTRQWITPTKEYID